MQSTTIHWRYGREQQKYPGFRAIAGNADQDTEGATRHILSENANGEMSLLRA